MIEIARILPPLIRMRDWQLLFDMDSDGNSMQTFYTNVRKKMNTIILIEDKDGWVSDLVAYSCVEIWSLLFRSLEESVQLLWHGGNVLIYI